MKILLCADSELVQAAVALALEPAGHQVVAARDPVELTAEGADAGVLLADAPCARRAAALLRDRGFGGRALLLGDGDPTALAALAGDMWLDGAVLLSPPEGLATRLAAALTRRRKVLIVDDSEIVARLLAEELTDKGFEIQYAPDAERAASIILRRNTRPDLILLDLNMPKVDGAQFCRFVKRNDRFKAIKVLLCSGEDREKLARLAQECGADGFLHKDEVLGKWVVDNAG